MTMPVHDALEAWQSGHITSRRAMVLTGADDVLDLYALAESCDVATRTSLLPAEERTVEMLVEAVNRQDTELSFGMSPA